MSGAYAPRDVLNASAIKSVLASRSLERDDPPEVTAWLLNHLFRHVVGNLVLESPGLLRVDTVAQARDCFDPAPVPEWAERRLSANKACGPAWWIDPEADGVRALELRLVEFLGSRRGTALEGKLMRINCPQALALWAAEHVAFGARSSALTREHSPEAVREVLRGDHGSWFELLPGSASLRSEMAFESQEMRHCLGQFTDRRALSGGYGEHYAAACERGELRLFSYRTARRRPRITMSARVEEGGTLAIDQIKGKQNRAPIARYRAALRSVLDALPTGLHTPINAVAAGLARTAAGWRAIEDVHDPAEQLRLVDRCPAAITSLPAASAPAQWLVAARQPELLRGLRDLHAGVAAAIEGPGSC